MYLLIVGDRKKRGGKKQQSTTVDHDHLSSNYYGSVISGLAFVENLQCVLGEIFNEFMFVLVVSFNVETYYWMQDSWIKCTSRDN